MSKQDKKKKQYAFRDLKIQISRDKENDWDKDSVKLKLKNLEYSDEYLTEKQLRSLIQQLIEKVQGMKFTIPSAINCPNCNERLDEIEGKEDTYHCEGCNAKINMRFEK